MPSPPRVCITGDEYTAIDNAYNWFNEQLFGGRLPPCLITLQRKGRSRGYFANDRFGHRLKVGDLTDGSRTWGLRINISDPSRPV